MTTTLSTGALSMIVHRVLHLHADTLPRARLAAGAHRHVILPKHVAKNAPKGRLLSESEWRGLGVQQSRGWVHYAIHR